MEDLPGYGLGYRHIQVILIFSMVVIGQIMSFAVPSVIVAITNPGTSRNPNIPSYPKWNDQSLILMSYYWGNAPALLLGGPLCKKYDTKWLMVISVLVASLVSFVMPSCIEAFGSVAFIICFLIQGVSQGVIEPMLSDFISRWVPLVEITTTGTWIFAGTSLGGVIATGISGIMASSWYGWPSVFYFAGAIGSIWCVFMVIFGYANPEQHESITINELEYIKRGKHLTKKRIPWGYILKSPPVWATWIAQVSLAWTLRLCLSEMPTYINRVLGIKVTTGSRILSVIYLMCYINSFIISGVSQYLINKKYLTVSASRKICNSIGSWGTAFSLFLLGTFNFGTYSSLFVIFLSSICQPAALTGFNINYNDLSPNYAACLTGIGGVAATVVSSLPLTLVQFMVTDQENHAQWGSIFRLAALITSSGNLIFLWKGEADIQEWDYLKDEDSEDKESYLDLDNKSLLD